MKFIKTPIEGAMVIELDKHQDHRGFFARGFCKKEFEEYGLEHEIVQCNFSKSMRVGTLRGMHYQSEPFSEVKMVRCVNGAIYDVIVDLRKESQTYKKWFGVKLTERNLKMLYIPKGLAHGFQTLKRNSVIYYMVTEYYSPQAEKGIRWNDPAFNIQWPIEIKDISEKDKSYVDFFKPD